MNGTYCLVLEIEPQTKGRPRFGKYGAYTPAKTRKYENELKAMIRSANPAMFVGPIIMEISFYMPRPKKPKYKYPAVKPDIDNLQKALLDACNGLLYEDDAQIIELTARKEYGAKPRIELVIISKSVEESLMQASAGRVPNCS